MTKTIKTNLIRLLTFIVAITCAFGILTMPSTRAWADSSSPIALEDFQMASSEIRLNVTSEDKTGLQFAAKMNINWARYGAREDSLSKLYPDVAKKDIKFGIVIADEDEPTVETDGSIKISYVDKAMIEGYKPGTTESWWTGGIATYYASITYRIDKLKEDFIAHDEEVKAKVAAGEISAADAKYYFSNGVYNDNEFEALMDRVYAEKLYARAYVEIPTAEGTVYLYSANTIANSVRTVATDKYFANKDNASWMAEHGSKVTKYLGVITENAAYIDSSNGKIQGKALSAYTEFSMNGETLVVGEDITFDGTTAILSSAVCADMAVGQTYTITAKDAFDNYLFLNVTPVTKILTTAQDIYNTFNLSTNNSQFCKPVGSFYSCTVTGTYILGNDIDMTGVKLDHNLVCASDGATMPASYGVGFYGTFDGCGYTISNLDLTRSCNVYQMGQTDNFRPLTKDEAGNVLSQGSSYYPAVTAGHTCGHSSGKAPGLFASLGYGATIKNVALTNVTATDSSVIAMSVEGASTLDTASRWEAFAGYEEATGNDYAMRASKSTATTVCTGEAGCPVHGNDDCSATTGKKFYQCTGAAHCLYHQTTQAHDAGWCPVVLEDSSYIYVGIVADKVYLRKETIYGTLNAAKAGAGITYENLYIDINESTSNFRGVFNTFGASKTDAITTMKNIIVNYNGAAATAENTGIMRGESRISTSANNYKDLDFAKTEITDLVVISKNAANLAKWKASGVALHTVVAGNKVEDGATVLAGVMQYSSIEEYMAAIANESVSIAGFNTTFWNKNLGFPYWAGDYADTITFEVNGEASDGTLEYTALAMGGEPKVFTVTAKNYFGNAIEFEQATSTNEAVATVTKAGVITVATTSSLSEDVATVTLKVEGKTFTATITLQGGFTVIDDVEVVYDEYTSQFNFNSFSVDVDDDDTNDNSVVFNNDTILSATVIYGNESTTLEKTTVNYIDYGTINGKNWEEVPGYVGAASGNRDTNVMNDDTIKQRTGFVGNVVKFAVNGEYGNYTPVLYTQKLMVTIQVGEEVKTYVFNNLKAYTAIITNIGQIGDIFKITASDPLNYGYYVLANHIQAQRGSGYYKYVHESLSGAKGFQGVFDGQGYQINEGFHVNGANEFGTLFGVIRSTSEMPTTIRNLSVSQYSGSTEATMLARSIESDVYENVNAGGTTIKVAKYPVEFKNLHIKPKTKTIHGLVRSDSGTVAYKFKNVLINLENLSTTNGQNIGGGGGLLSGNTTMLVSNGSPGYSETTHQPQMLGLARDAYYTNAYENVVAIMNFPVMSFIKSSTTAKVDSRDPLDIYLTAYGWNRIGKAGVALSKYVYNTTDNVLAVLSSQATLTPFAGTEENDYADATPYATLLTTGTYTGESGTAYSTVMEQAFFFKSIWQYYNFGDAVAQYNNEASGEKAMFDEMVATGYFVKRTKALGHSSDDTKLVWAAPGAVN